jgi:predicted phage-related endonuclease
MLEGAELASWLSERAGCCTASRLRDVLAVSKQKGKEGTPLKARADYIREILAERMTGASMPHFVSDAMRDGLAYEDEAKAMYEAHTGIFLKPTAFYRHPRIEFFGATPDGLVGDDGLVEVKVPTSPTFVGWVMDGVIPDEHKPQMLGQMACTGRQWCDFVAYEPRAMNPRARLFIRRYHPTPAEIAEVEAAAERFLAEVQQAWEILTASNTA